MASDSDIIIIGGGGLYSRSFFPLNSDYLTLLKESPVVIYGLGYNRNLEYEDMSSEQKKSILDLHSVTNLN